MRLLLLGFTAVCAGFRPSPACAESGALEVQCQVALDGAFRPGGWSTIVLEVRNPGPDLQACVRVRVPGEGTEFRRVVDLPHNARRRVWVPFSTPAPPARPDRVLVQLLTLPDGRVLWVQEPRLAGVTLTRALLLVYGRGAPLVQVGLLPPPDDRSLEVHVVPAGGLPEVPEAYGAARALLLTGVEDGSVSPRQAQALATWLRCGGDVVFVWEPGWHPERALSKAVLPPVEVTGERPLTDLSAFREFHPKEVVATGLLAADVRPAPGAGTRFTCQARPLVCEQVVGLGRVTWVGIDVSRPFWSHWPGTQAMWRRWLGVPRLADDVETWSGADESERLRRALSAGARLAPPLGSGWVLFFAVAYGLVVGPGLYFVFRRRRKALLGLVAYPGVVLVFSGLAFVLSGTLRSTVEVCRLLTLLDVAAGGGAARGLTHGVLLLPRNADAVVRSSRETVWLKRVRRSEGGFLGAAAVTGFDVDSRFQVGPEGAELRFGTRSWTPECFEAEWRTEGEAPVAARFAVAEGRPALTIRNRTGAPLQGLVLVRPGGRLSLPGEVGPGEQTLPLEGVPGRPPVATPGANSPGSGASGASVSAEWSEPLLRLVLGGHPDADENEENGARWGFALKVARAAAARRQPDESVRCRRPRHLGETPYLLAWSRAGGVVPLSVSPIDRPIDFATLFRVEVEAEPGSSAGGAGAPVPAEGGGS